MPTTVKTIGNMAFAGCNDLTDVFADNNQIENIGEGAFCDCSKLSSVLIPAVKNIGEAAFSGCRSLESVTLGSALMSIGERAFCNCNNLTTIEIPKSVSSIGIRAFDSPNITKITVDSQNNSFTADAGILFNKEKTVLVCCPRGNEQQVVDVPESVVTIDEWAFAGCSNLTAIKLGNNVETIGDYAFRECSGLANIDWGSSIKKIGERSFVRCESIKKLELPNSLEELGESAFDGCGNLESVKFGTSLDLIKSGAFSSCGKLTRVYISDLTAWCKIKFKCDNAHPFYTYSAKSEPCKLYLNNVEVIDLEIPEGVKEINTAAFYGCEGLNSVVLPETVESIGGDAFRKCSGLTSLSIPTSLKTIGDYAFSGCDKLGSVFIKDLQAWCNIDFDYYSSAHPFNRGTDSFENKIYLNGTEITDLSLPEGVSSIKKYTFLNCNRITSVTIPSSVESIGKQAFSRCARLSTASIGSGLQNVDPQAFYGCTSLDVIRIEALTPPTLGLYAFYQVPVSGGVFLYVPKASINDYKQAEGWKDFYVSNFIGRSFKANISYPEGLSTFYVDYPVEIPEGVTVFYGKKISSENVLNLEKVEDGIIPANTGVIVKGIKNSFGDLYFNEADVKGTDIDGNLLVGSSYAKTFDEEGFNFYKLTYADATHNPETFGFYLDNEDGTVDAKPNKAYLKLPKSAGANMVRMRFIDDETTDIQTIVNEAEANNSDSYNLSGQKVGAGYKGIVVKNGKKMIVK